MICKQAFKALFELFTDLIQLTLLKNSLGCFNLTLGQTWTNPSVGLNFKITLYPNVWYVHI